MANACVLLLIEITHGNARTIWIELVNMQQHMCNKLLWKRKRQKQRGERSGDSR